MSPQYGELRPTSAWDRCVSLGHPCKFQRVSHLGSVTARHSSRGRQPNFAALNRGHHLYSAGRPSHWALAHISSIVYASLYVGLLQKWFTCPIFHKYFDENEYFHSYNTRQNAIFTCAMWILKFKKCIKHKGSKLWNLLPTNSKNI